MTEKYVNPLTDYGFKKIFGDKEVMKEFLNDIISPDTPIEQVEFLDKEMLAATHQERGIVYDLRCVTQDGSEFIVEMQKCGQRFFGDRMLYYMSRSISQQGVKGKASVNGEDDLSKWNFRLNPVYGVFLLDFHLSGLKPQPFRTVGLRVDGTGEKFSSKVTIYTLELPDFREMSEADCKSKTDYWSYMMTHLENNARPPFEEAMPIFERVATIAELSNMDSAELRRYQDEIDTYRTNRAAWDYNYEQGIDKGWAEGLAEGKAEGEMRKTIEIARAMKQQGIPVETIAACTKLSVEEVINLSDG